FEVAGGLSSGINKTPFIVRTTSQAVAVLGTQFNITAYPDEQVVSTTLASGAVKVIPIGIHENVAGDGAGSGKYLHLMPGEQSILHGSKLTKGPVNVAAVTAWKDNEFNFTGKSLRQVMTELERWYDINVSYEGS